MLLHARNADLSSGQETWRPLAKKEALGARAEVLAARRLGGGASEIRMLQAN